ncbi:heterokaryon incompatibility protein-domain-containing protein [Xylaria sp. FL1042]|nr:heterokaryon incompatibility protein-domain-containing protein [Xylaria sp. FL1042]
MLVFTGFSKTFSFNDLHKVAFQQHYPSLKSLRISAQTYRGCALFLHGLTAGERQERVPGLFLKHVGAESFGRDLWDPSLEEEPIVLRGLGREGLTDERKQLYGILAQCGTVMECASYQRILSNAPSLPTRVLDLETKNPGQARLVLGAGLEGRYFTKVIDVAGLNKTFQDAIMITRLLGFRYLWIDSLCIIQDDTADWQREASRMAHVYSQAHLTITTSAASDRSQGLFRDETELVPFELSVDSRDKFLNQGCSVGFAPLRFRRLIVAPLNTRAWTLQERILSSRILHYARDQLHWECREAIISEAGGPPYGETLDASGEESFHTGWLGRVSEDLLPRTEAEVYSQLTMTNESDKLPALPGIAHAYSLSHNSQYLAGLWLGGIATGLLWFNRTTDPLRRTAQYRAPSWSWASIYDLVAHIELGGLDPFGRVRYGELSLWGAIKPAKVKTIRGEDEFDGDRLSTQMIFDDVSAIGSATLDYPIPDGEVLCLLIATGYDSFGMRLKNNLVLVLRPTDKVNEFTRLGISIFYESRNHTPERTVRPYQPMTNESLKNKDWFYDTDLVKITLV